MSTWWVASPYSDIAIYIGGSNRSCPQPNLTSSWVNTRHTSPNEGWNFYLTWVGPQAPCTGFASRFSYDGPTADDQGRAEADKAVQAARNLGFTGNNIYYYDLEGYNTSDTACRNAVKKFINAWVSRLHNAWTSKAGAYGSSCASAVSDWASLNNPIDDAWIAHWSNDPDVWGLACVSNSLWANVKRLHQYQRAPYTRDHDEMWGNVTIRVDNDCAYGQITPHGSGNETVLCTTE